ncbi:MAG: thioredoxin family protein [bacterium]|nr:thioredoxin family protein [bacterium]
MEILILATKDCSHRPILEKKLKEMSVNYQLKFVEDDSKAVDEYQIRNSPNIIIDGKVVFRASPEASLPTDEELKNYLKGK